MSHRVKRILALKPDRRNLLVVFATVAAFVALGSAAGVWRGTHLLPWMLLACVPWFILLAVGFAAASVRQGFGRRSLAAVAILVGWVRLLWILGVLAEHSTGPLSSRMDLATRTIFFVGLSMPLLLMAWALTGRVMRGFVVGIGLSIACVPLAMLVRFALIVIFGPPASGHPDEDLMAPIILTLFAFFGLIGLVPLVVIGIGLLVGLCQLKKGVGTVIRYVAIAALMLSLSPSSSQGDVCSRRPDLDKAREFLDTLYLEQEQLFRIDQVQRKIYPYGAIHAVKLYQPTDPERANTLVEGLARYGLGLENGEYEVYFGKVVEIPFHARFARVLREFTNKDGYIWQVVIDEADPEYVMNDWEQYASLLLFGSLSRYNEGRVEEAHRLFDKAMNMWDGRGFFDKYVQVEGHYASYVIGLALYASRAIDRPIPPSQSSQMNCQLHRVQYESGGIATLYDSKGQPFGTAADEPTILTILGYLGEHSTEAPHVPATPTPSPTAVPKLPAEVPLAAILAGWYGYDVHTGECQEGIGSYHWNDTSNTAGVVHTPYRGFYCSSDPELVSWQLEQMERAGIQVILFSWWGWGDTDLDGSIEGHADQYINEALTELLNQIRDTGSDMEVAIIVEPFTVPQAGLQSSDLSYGQKEGILDYLWDQYYAPYLSHIFHWQGKPLLLDFDPMMLPEDPRFTIRHWTGRARGEDTVAEGWQWFFAPPQDIVEAMSEDGTVFVYPRFDEYYAKLFGADYITWEPRRIDPFLEEGVYEQQWRQVVENREKAKLIVLYGWNLYGEQAQIEPSGEGPGAVGHDYVEKTREYYQAFLEGRDVELPTGRD